MLELKGIDAAIMCIAKGRLDTPGATLLERLQLGLAQVSGLNRPQSIREADILNLVSSLHDRLMECGLLKPTARGLQDVLSRASRSTVQGVQGNLLARQMASLALVEVRNEAGQALLDWQDGLPSGFLGACKQMHMRTQAAAR